MCAWGPSFPARLPEGGAPTDGPQGQAGVSPLFWPGSGASSAAPQNTGPERPLLEPLLHTPRVQLLSEVQETGPQVHPRVWTPETRPECPSSPRLGPPLSEPPWPHMGWFPGAPAHAHPPTSILHSWLLPVKPPRGPKSLLNKDKVFAMETIPERLHPSDHPGLFKGPAVSVLIISKVKKLDFP